MNVKALLLSLIIVINSREMRESHCVTHSSIMADAYLGSLEAAKITGFCASLCVITEFENESKKSHFTPLRAKRATIKLNSYRSYVDFRYLSLIFDGGLWRALLFCLLKLLS